MESPPRGDTPLRRSWTPLFFLGPRPQLWYSTLPTNGKVSGFLTLPAVYQSILLPLMHPHKFVAKHMTLNNTLHNYICSLNLHFWQQKKSRESNTFINKKKLISKTIYIMIKCIAALTFLWNLVSAKRRPNVNVVIFVGIFSSALFSTNSQKQALLNI